MKFGEVAECVNDRVDDPAKAGVDRYVGLEHIDPETLTIRRWGAPNEVESTKLRFKPGDIIFGKRRAYQRKLAVADFEGICSAHAMVLRARDGAIVPEFLPFFMQSDMFMNRAVAISVGSLSPTINWKTLAAEEFALPPLEEQRRYAELLRAMGDVHESLMRTLDAQRDLREAILRDEFSSLGPEVSLQSVCRPIVRGIDSPGPEVENGTPYVRIAEMTGPEGIVVSKLKRTSRQIAEAHPESKLTAGDLVVALRGVVGLPVRVPEDAEGANLSRGTARVSVLPEQSVDFVFYALQSQRVRREILRVCTGWKGEDLREITLTSLRELRVPVPPRDIQDRLGSILSAIDHARRQVEQRLLALREHIAKTSTAFAPDASHVH